MRCSGLYDILVLAAFTRGGLSNKLPFIVQWKSNVTHAEDCLRTGCLQSNLSNDNFSFFYSGLEPEPLTSPFVHNMLGFLPALQEKEKPPLNLVGNVMGKIAIIVDDIIDDVDDYVNAAELLHQRGAYKVWAILLIIYILFTDC